jgi:hypothetical protein
MNKGDKIFLIFTIVILGTLTLLLFSKEERVQVLRHYSPDTKQTDSLEYVIRHGDTVFHGKFTTYNEKGVKIAEGNMVNGHVKGKCIYYFDHGAIESIFYRKDANITEESTKYYVNGKIKRYTLYDPKGLVAFVVNYDKRGNVKDYDGYPIIEIYQFEFLHKEKFPTKKVQYLEVGDTLKYKYLIANIPYAKRNLNIELLEADNTKIKRVITKILPVETDVEEIITKKGINTIRAIVKYQFDNKEKTVIKDTISFDVEIH